MFNNSTKNNPPHPKSGTGFGLLGLSLGMAVYLCLLCLASPIYADVTTTGDVVPADPTTWTSDTGVYIGKISNGTLDITSGSTIRSGYGYIGNQLGSTGVVTIDGAGSKWTNTALYLGGNEYFSRKGDGTLTITNGGTVISGRDSYIGSESRSTGVVTVDGTDSIWKTNDDLYIGDEGSGTLRMINGGVVETKGYVWIADNSGSLGVVTVDGVNSRWTANYDLHIGNFGSGILNVFDGEVTVKKITWVAKEEGSSGAIHFNNGTLTTSSFFGAADNLTGTGTINTHGLVSDADFIFDASHGLSQTFVINKNNGQNITVNLDIDSQTSSYWYMGAGYGGTGTMSISDGRVIESHDGYIGYKSGSAGKVTVNGTGSTWNLKTSAWDMFLGYNNIKVGYFGSGTLNITEGGVVSNDSCYIGVQAGSVGKVTVDGTDSALMMFDGLSVGHWGSGTLNITNGGTVSTNDTEIGYRQGSMGEITIDGIGSTLTSRYGFFVGHWGNGIMNIINGGTVTGGGGQIGYDAGATGKVTVDGVGSTWTNSGILLVGYGDISTGKGTLTITDGGLVSVASILTIDKNGDGDSFVNMASGGMLALMGDADDSLGDFLDLVEGTDAIRYWEASAFGWADITGATYGEDYTLGLGEGDLAGYTVLTVLAEVHILGDVNGDGLVNGFDVDPFVDVLLNGPYRVEADINEDGVVDGFDVDPFVSWVLGGNGADGAPVPEPATIGVLGVMLLGMIKRHR